jgi:two-component system nitrogen regulation sensor histidine kinase GlnL
MAQAAGPEDEFVTISDPTSAAHEASLRARLVLLGRLAGSVSHAMRNPLSAVSLHTDILAEELSQSDHTLREQLLDSLMVITAGITRMGAMVQQYLTLARLSVVSCTIEDLGALLEAFRHEMRHRLASQNMAVHIEGVDNLHRVALDTMLCHQVLLHLVESATEILSHGGVVTVRGRQTGQAVHLDIHVAAADIREATAPRIVHNASLAEPGGWEFAVFLAHQLVLAHHGEIAISSKPDMGTTVTVTLPLPADTETPAEPVQPQDPPAVRRRDKTPRR